MLVPDLSATVETLLFGPGGGMPNNPALPVVAIRGAVPGGAAPGDLCALMEARGWGGTWVWTVYDYHHYHPDAHEALAVAAGRAALVLGGPNGVRVAVEAGDVLILPAGTGHCRRTASPDFAICGAYPPGQARFRTWREVRPEAVALIAATPLPVTDPIYGADGPLTRLWN